MGRTVATPLKSAYDILKDKGRSYIFRKRYFQVVVFSKWWSEVEILKYTFNGHIHKHRTGYVWMVSSRDDLIRLLGMMDPFFPSVHGFEVKILPYYPTKNVTP